MKFTEKLKAIDNKIVNSEWTPRVIAGATVVSTAMANGISVFADDVGGSGQASDAASTLGASLASSAMEAVQSGYTSAIPVLGFGLTVSIIVRKIMGAARRC